MSAGFSVITLTIAIAVHISLRGKRFSDVVKPEESEASEDKSPFAVYNNPPPAYDDIFVSHI